MSYFLIYQNDKEATVKKVTEKELQEMLKEMVENEEEVIFISKIESTDPAYWEENASLLIKGEIIVPKPKKFVTKYEID